MEICSKDVTEEKAGGMKIKVKNYDGADCDSVKGDQAEQTNSHVSTLKSSFRSDDDMADVAGSEEFIVPEVTLSVSSAPITSDTSRNVELKSPPIGQDRSDVVRVDDVTPSTSVIVVSDHDSSVKDDVIVDEGSIEAAQDENKQHIEPEVTCDNQPVGEGRLEDMNQSATRMAATDGASELDSSLKAALHDLAVMFYRSQAEDQSDEPKLPAQINYLILAVKTDAPHLVEALLNRYTGLQVYSALLYSINLGRDHITKLFLDHPKYEAVRQVTELIKSGTLHQNIADQPEEEIAEEVDESVLAADVTPLMLAAQRNQFEVVQNLLDKGECIEEPHHTGCSCKACDQRGMDELREAKTKLTTFKALASDSYIVLASDDPVFVAFELAQKLKNLATEEKHFKADYLKLAENIEDFTGRLLDRVRDGNELDILLNEKLGSGLSSYDNLARLKLAIQHEEKKFVAHPSCQKKLASLWMGHINPEWVSTPCRALLFLILLCLCYPFAAILYWIYPYNKLGRFLQIPLVKFAAATGSYFIFVALVISYGAAERPTPTRILCDYSAPIGVYCKQYMYNVSDPYVNATSTYVRHHSIGIGTYLLGVWLLGLIWENVKKLYTERYMYFTQNMFNILDFVMLWLFIFSFLFKFIVIGLVNNSLSYFAKEESWIKLAQHDNEATSHIYWINADRSTWVIYDLTTLSEAIFAVASLLSISKLTFIFTMSERIGPLIISLAKMIEDMLAFMVLFVFMMGAFVVGFHNLFWYFYMSQERIGLQDEDIVSSFSSIEDIVKECFWSIFGLVEMDDKKFYTTENGYVTSVTGHVMFAFYNWMMIIILINMLIAMMSRSYEFIAEKEDTEWKFARTKLFLEYIREGSTMPPPLNLIPTWKGIYLLHRRFSDNWCRRCAGRPVKVRSRGQPTSPNNESRPAIDLNGRPTTASMSNMSLKRSERLKYLNNSVATPEHRELSTNSKQPRPEYLQVIGEVKKRFIQQYGKGKHGEDDSTSDDLDQLKQDMSTLRQELTSAFRRQDRERARMSNALSDITSRLRDTRQLIVSQHHQLRQDHTVKTNNVTYQVHDVDQRINDLKTQVSADIMALHRQVELLSRDSRVSFEILRDSVYRLCADVSVIRGPGALAREMLARRDVIGDDDVGGRIQSAMVLAGQNAVGVTSQADVTRPSMTTVLGSGDAVTTTSGYGPVSVTARTVVLKK